MKTKDEGECIVNEVFALKLFMARNKSLESAETSIDCLNT